ncbi:hypothetical protein BS17DRAFT_788099 [Gyrodon lividus]|nr:hypothetical protein BS17DRAFT_788099 [Gyrodon lividus]
MDFTFVIKNVTFNDPIAKMTPESIQRLRNPPQGPVDIDSPGIRHRISCYLLLEHASQKAYDGVIKLTCRNFPQAEGVQDWFYSRPSRLSLRITPALSMFYTTCAKTHVLALLGRSRTLTTVRHVVNLAGTRQNFVKAMVDIKAIPHHITRSTVTGTLLQSSQCSGYGLAERKNSRGYQRDTAHTCNTRH